MGFLCLFDQCFYEQSDYKEIVQTFENETEELVHISVADDEIVTTPKHPFYVPHKGWTSAIDLRAGDILVLSNGEYVIVEKVQHEILESPVKVYNFEVRDFHTYYVGENSVLVHNMCQVNPEAKVQENDDSVSQSTVGRWMSEDEYNKMIESGRVQMSPNGNTTYVAYPADIDAFGKQAKNGSLYVEFDVPSDRINAAGKNNWGQIPGPDSLIDRLNKKKGLPQITDMPEASNIIVKGRK